MLEALSAEEAAFYAAEENVLEWGGKSMVIFRELEVRYGFVGGSYRELLALFHRNDIDPTIWNWQLQHTVKAIAGLSFVPKK